VIALLRTMTLLASLCDFINLLGQYKYAKWDELGLRLGPCRKTWQVTVSI